jgi:hypothetical protein
MKTIYTNGKSLFTLNNYDKTSGVCHVHGITIHGEASNLTAKSMHAKGIIHYIDGIGDRKVFNGIKLNRNTKFDQFKIW